MIRFDKALHKCEPVPRESGKNSYLNLSKASQYLASDQTGCYPYLEIGLEVDRPSRNRNICHVPVFTLPFRRESARAQNCEPLFVFP